MQTTANRLQTTVIYAIPLMAFIGGLGTTLALIQLLEENLIPRQLEATIHKHLVKIVEEHANEQLFQGKEEYVGFRADIVEQLDQNSYTCNALGHDVIYAYNILDLLSHKDVPATTELFNAMKKLLNDFKASGPGYVTINGNGNRRYAAWTSSYPWAFYSRIETCLERSFI